MRLCNALILFGLISPSHARRRKLQDSGVGEHNCTLVKVELTMAPDQDEAEFNALHREEDEWRCILEDEDDVEAYEIEGLPSGYIRDHMAEWSSGMTVMHISESTPHIENLTVTVQNGAKISTEAIVESDSRRRRRLSSATGEQTVLVVRVTDSVGDAPEKSAAALAEDVFSDDVNLETFYTACSGGKLTYKPATGDGIIGGVMEITLDDVVVADVSSYTVEGYVDAIIGKPDGVDLVAIVLPWSVDFGGAAGYAYLNYWRSVFRGEYGSLPMVLAHEIGHNLGLYHSGKDGQSYGDKTCIMGNGVYEFWIDDETPKLCFNAAKSWQLGWYADRHQELAPVSVGYSWKGDMVGVDDYLNDQIPEGSTDYHVLAKINTPTDVEDIYFMYNRKEGINADVPYDYDKVVIVKQEGNLISWNVAQLGQGETYIESFNDSTDLVIEVCDIQEGTPDYAKTVVCLVDSGVTHCSCDTVTGAPTASNVDESTQPSLSANPSTEFSTNTPTKAHTQSPSNMPTVSDDSPHATVYPTTSSGDCSGKIIEITIQPDSFPKETTWTLVNQCTGVTALQGGPYDNSDLVTFTSCVADAKYTFEIEDSWGDGICCSHGNGYYNGVFGGVEVFSGDGTFGNSESHEFGFCDCAGKIIQITIQPDGYPTETTWTLVNQCTGVTVLQGGPYDNSDLSTTTSCVADAKYTFEIKDNFGDGICCSYGDGYYNGVFDGVEVFSGDGSFSDSESYEFGSWVASSDCIKEWLE